VIAAWVAAVCAPAPVEAAEERPVLFSLALEDSPLDRCGGAAALASAVETQLRRQVFTKETSSDIAIAVRPGPVRETGAASWNAEIVEKDRTGTELGRRDVPLPTSDCAKARDTLAVVLAIMIGPERTTTDVPHVEPVVPPEPAAPPTTPPPAEQKPAPKQPPRSIERLRWMASPFAGAVVGTGVLPRTASAFEVGVLVRPPIRRLSVIARGAYWPEATTPTLPPAQITRIGGALLGCLDLIRSGSFGAMGCAGGDLTRLRATSAELTRASDGSAVVAVLGEARLGYRLPVPGSLVIEPFFAPQMSLLLVRDRFTYRDPSGRERVLLLPSPVAFQAGFGVAVHFL
jgi:hypothetical protein